MKIVRAVLEAFMAIQVTVQRTVRREILVIVAVGVAEQVLVNA